VGGEADGGGVYVNGAPLVINGGTSQAAQTVVFNVAAGGEGGAGGLGGIAHRTAAAPATGVGGVGGAGGNGGQGQGGGLFVTGNGLSITLGNATTTATFDHNTATGGRGGGQNGGLNGNGSENNENGGFNDNGLGGNGGAGGNGAAGTGGGASIVGNNTLTVTNVSMQSNTVAGGGGGNGGNAGGNGSVGVGGNAGNGAQGQGAGLYILGSSNATVLNSTLSDNMGFGSEGGNGGKGAKNPAPGVKGNNGGNGGNAGIIQGGGLYAANSTVAVLNSTIADNRNENGLQGYGGTGLVTGANGAVGAAQGAGLFATGGNLTLTNATVAWNFLYLPFGSAVSTDLGAGVYNDTTNTLKMQNTIVALDQLYSNSSPTPSSTPSDVYGNVSSSDHDFIGDGTGSNLVNGTNGDQVGTDAAPLDPQFTAPAPTQPANGQEPSNNGGLTPTLVLNWGSSAINAGDPSAATAIASAEGLTNSSDATDQRGQPRVIDGTIDIGATETQLLLSGSAPPTVTAGSTITYTLTVTNNESTAVGVTLTDTTPANTTFQSFTAPSGWSTPTTPSVGSTGTVTTSIASLAPNTTATFTLVVTVGASTPGSTVIANMPSISTTATAPAVSFTRGITLDTTVPGATTTDITSSVFLRESPVFPAPEDGPNDFAQAVFLINTSGETINGPVALVLNGLPAGVTLLNANGTYNGSPYIDILPTGGSWKAGWRHFVLPFLHFNNPDNVKISYTAQIIEGI